MNKFLYNLFLDDLRWPCDAVDYTPPGKQKDAYEHTQVWQIVRNYDQFVATIESQGIPEMVSFDHDLADEHYCPEVHYITGWDKWAETQEFKEKTGYECARWLKEYAETRGLPLPVIYCHSMNPVGRERILSVFEEKPWPMEEPEEITVGTKPTIQKADIDLREDESYQDALNRYHSKIQEKIDKNRRSGGQAGL